MYGRVLQTFVYTEAIIDASFIPVLYNARQPQGGPLPTTFSFPGREGSIVHVKETKPLKKVYPNFSIPVNYFKKSASFTLRVKFKPGTTRANLQARFMTCGDKICLYPDINLLKVALEK